MVLLEENVDDEMSEVRSVGSESQNGGKRGGFEFLSCVEGEERVEELDRKRIWKWQDDGTVKQKGLLNMPGWVAREKEG